MTLDDRALVRWTVGSGVVGGGLFLGVTAWRALTAGAALRNHVGVLLAMALIGFTVGGLVGPLLLAITRHVRRP